jgi:hypothetical protein
LLAGGIFQQELLVNLRDVQVQDLTLQHPGLQYLTYLPAVQDGDEYTRFRETSKSGIDANGFEYRVAVPVKVDSTYALRSIAYRAQYLRSIDGIKYDELDFDKRRDVIVVFHVIDRDSHGNTTILWKLLKDAEAPKLKVKK